MMAGRLMRWATALVGSSGALLLNSNIVTCENQHTGKEHKERIAVYLKPESKELLQKSLIKHQYVNNAVIDFVSVNPAASKDDVHVFKPLFGNRTAFRLKGLITLDDGRAVGIGRLSNMAGELKDPSAEVALPILPDASIAADTAKMQELLDIPSRMLQSVSNLESRPVWKGRIPSGKVGDRKYNAISGVHYIRLPKERQVVVDGYLCSSYCVNAEGKCEFEPVDHKADIPNPKASTSPEEARPIHEDEASLEKETEAMSSEHHARDDAANECPVCRFLKGGQCKEEFLVWDACMKGLKDEDDVHSCYAPTKTMMLCMRQYEYYDIMVAGMDFDKYLALETANSDSSSSSP